MRLPRVAVITPGTFPIPSGASSSVERVVEYVVSMAAERMEARIYGRLWPGQAQYGLVRGVPCERIRSSTTRSYIRDVIHGLAAFNPDIVQVENRPRFVLELKRSFPNTKVWLNLHSTTFMSRKHISVKLLRTAFRSADRIFVNSRYLYEEVRRKVPDCEARIVINPLGVDGARFRTRWSEEGRERYTAGKSSHGWEERKVVLYVGRLIPLKGVHHLLQAVPRLKKSHPEVLLVIVGSAFYGSKRKTKYVRRLERIGRRHREHVRFVPYVSHEEVPSWYAMADVVVVPSVRREAFGLVNVEAMASGVPVIASRVGGIQEVVVDEKTGLLVPPHRMEAQLSIALERLLSDRALCEQLGQAGVEHVESLYTWRRTAERWADEISLCATASR
ncbi:glycosyltransferase family 4 protein [Paenibacillus sp. UMB4589-SE434]|uniref:glycosyltransferase family 4 protein n=1 Tax=Paenibacillus sp. UMB4589-SE434 TaxID=3046314 RepID=UPI002550267B|nr:glycosyltransferase family 4 protein [Paenibacillus sp. UMB4589-SE434]MDK8183637.1 glycosyltransferase family 4 protein [Paenibacillus sp. UMB4589-SE434]